MVPSPLRIVQIVETLAVGGLEVLAVNLAIAHRNAGHFSAIYTVFEPGSLEKKALAAGVPVIPFHKKKGFSPKAIIQIVRRLCADGAQVVHTHNSSIHHYGALAGSLAGAAVVNTRHGLALHSSKRQEVYFKTVLPLTRAVVFVCEAGRRHYASKGIAPKGKSWVIIGGVPLESFGTLRATPGSRQPTLRFGAIGRLVKAKAHHDLVDAFARIAKELPSAELEIWGVGTLQGELENQISDRGLSNCIHYRGLAVNPAEIFRNLDIFVLSSTGEGGPLVVMEAMAAGVPIVSTRVGAIAEVVPEGCGVWFAEPGDPASLAEAMRRAAASDLAAAGQAASSAASRYFGMETMQRAYESVYRTAMELT
jgi:glycosyltransferase involved in cell wall biosynthesis